jgi:hypothetical protein
MSDFRSHRSFLFIIIVIFSIPTPTTQNIVQSKEGYDGYKETTHISVFFFFLLLSHIEMVHDTHTKKEKKTNCDGKQDIIIYKQI